MGDISDEINSYINASREAKNIIERAKGICLESSDIQYALEDVLSPDKTNPVYLLSYNLTAERIIKLLEDYDFQKYKPELLETIEVDEPLIPEEIPRLLTEQTIKTGGEIWRIHKNDVDPFPSVPHAHNIQTGVVLHLGTGDLYDKQRNVIKNIGCKSLLAIRSKLSRFTLPKTTCN